MKAATAACVVLAYLSSSISLSGVDAFISCPAIGWVLPQNRRLLIHRHVSADNTVNPTTRQDENNDDMDDDQLLKQVPKSQLIELCEQCHLPTMGSKAKLLERLRKHADEQAELERQRHRERVARVEQGSDDSKERYEIVGDNTEDDDDDEGYFYFPLPQNAASANDTVTKKAPKPSYVTSNVITAPPPPPTEPDENGERVVTVYSTKDHNDLTGIAAAQPGQNSFANDAMMEGSSSSGPSPWDMKDAQYKAQATSKELDEAKETVTELVHALLTMTGAPAFREEFSEGLTAVGRKAPSPSAPDGFVGFDPSKVPTDILLASSQALRAGRGQVLQDVLRDYELRAVGHDGMGGDDIQKGGGHYREVSKVRAFLEGYRRAEVRRVARETTTMLLDKLVSEGVQGLDFLLATMTKSSDDAGEGGELNDSLFDYLNDAIRQQEKKVDQLLSAPEYRIGGDSNIPDNVVDEDRLGRLWNVTTEDGMRVETLDPKDPEVQKVLTEEFAKSRGAAVQAAKLRPKTAPEQLLLLLTLLRERVKTEAAFSNDEKGRNLRLLAHCLHVGTPKERENIIVKEMGSSIDRLDSFIELVASSIEYAESTTHQLQPSKSRPLNLNLLQSIHALAEDVRERQAWKASGVPQQRS